MYVQFTSCVYCATWLQRKMTVGKNESLHEEVKSCSLFILIQLVFEWKNIYKWQCSRISNSFNYISGAYGGCYRSGAKVKCKDTFHDEPLTLEIDVKSCKSPVKINIKLDILGVTHSKVFYRDQDIPLPELSISGLTDIFLTVDANPQDNGDLKLQVRC